MNLVNFLKNTLKNTPDLIIKDIKINMFNTIYIIYLETVSSSDKINEYILKNIILSKDKINKNNLPFFIAGANTKKVTQDECLNYLYNGFCIVSLNKEIYAVEVKANINRSISTPLVEASIMGPKDSFTENIQINIGLIKKRLKSDKLCIKSTNVGTRTNTNVNILYFNDLADINMVNKIYEKICNIDIDGIIDSSSIAFLLEDNTSVYPTYLLSERPDVCSKALLDGKIVIMVDTSPYAIIIPSLFIDFINPSIDNYNKSNNINFIKVLRLISFFISIITPALYIAIMNYNEEAIPTDLLVSFITQRASVPFPTPIEVLIMLFVYEILRESDLRFPSNFGSAISVLGAIILGDASVSAGIVSPITIIVIAITFICSLTLNNIEINNTLRYFRFIFIILASLFGLYGITLGVLYFLIYTTSIESFNIPFFAPLSPFNKEYFHDTVINKGIKKNYKRSKLFTKKNIIREVP